MHVEPDNLHEDIVAAFKAVETADTSGEPIVIPAKTEPSVGEGAVRGIDGKFVSSDPTKTAVPGQGGDHNADPNKGTALNDPSKVAVPPVSGIVDPNDPTKTGVQLDPAKPPQGWRPEAKAKWAAIPEDIRQEIIRREENSAQGVAKLRQQYEPMEKVYNEAITPALGYLAHIKREPVEYIQAMMMSEQTLTLGNPAQKMEKLLEIADTYGVPIRQALDSAMGGKLNEFIKEAHTAHKTPSSLPPEVAAELAESRKWREDMVQSAVKKEYDEFTAKVDTDYPFFEDVKDDMAALLDSGVCKGYTDAYETAVWRNPVIRAREQARLNGVAQTDAIRQRQIAAGQISTPGAAPLVTGVTAENAEETIEETVRKATMAASGRT